MRLRPLFLVIALAAAAAAAPAAAQDHQHAGLEQLGQVEFAVSCTPEARQRFERAMAVLHSFWWEEAPAAFHRVLEADSTCAMAHWGLALSAWGNPFTAGPGPADTREGAEAAARALALGAPTEKERGFLNAAGALYRDPETRSAPARLRAWSDTLARLHQALPGEPEVALYYALSLVATADPTDTTLARQRAAAGILTPLFDRYPDHPGLAHYIIHANDSPRLASLGLAAARRYAAIAPLVPHAQHMPSHIFIRLGLWDETIASNRRSYDAGITAARAQGLGGVFYHEFHALDYMVYGYLQRGRDSAARATVSLALGHTEVRSPTALVRSYNRTAMEARIPLERGDWAAAARVPIRDGEVPVSEMLGRFTRGIGAARSGAADQARDELAALARIEEALVARQDAYWARVAGIKRQALHAWVLLASGDTVGALREAGAAAGREEVTDKHPITPGELLPARELEADLLFLTGRYGAARSAYLATLTREPRRARAVFGAARSAELNGDTEAARAGYAEYLGLMEGGDGDRAELALARRGARR